jgi:hypothetical protein
MGAGKTETELRMDQDGTRYRTSDLYYAAYLKVAGVRFVETVRDGGRVFFLFEHQEGLRDLKNQYYSRTAKVPALTYADEIKTMKTLTYADRG